MKIAGKNPITELDYPDPDVIRVDDNVLHGKHYNALYAGV